MEWLLLFVLILIHQRLGDQVKIVSVIDFVEALENNSEPVVVHVNRKIFWIFTQKRNFYVQNYKGLKLGCLSFKPIELQSHVDLISVSKW
jgi:hypothetical protein